MKTWNISQDNLSRKLRIAGFCLITAILPALIQSCATTTYVSNAPEGIQPPVWAPEYGDINAVHYYYFPDIQVYYDVYRQEYVYMEDGYWRFSAFLPPFYSGFNVNNAYVVILNTQVHEPWMHHELYVSHYPRYYYQTAGYNPDYRGYNENSKTVISNPNRNMNNRVPNNDNANKVRTTNTNSNNSKTNVNSRGNDNSSHPRTNQVNSGNAAPNVEKPLPIRQEGPVRREPVTERRPAPVERESRTAPVIYKNKNVGQPVKVTKEMKPPKKAEGSKRRE